MSRLGGGATVCLVMPITYDSDKNWDGTSDDLFVLVMVMLMVLIVYCLVKDGDGWHCKNSASDKQNYLNLKLHHQT